LNYMPEKRLAPLTVSEDMRRNLSARKVEGGDE